MTVVPVTKSLPSMVSVKAAPPTVALLGERVLVVGNGLLIVKVNGADSPPLTSGSNTVTAKLPAVAISAAAMAVVNWVVSTNTVVLSTPLIRIIKPLTKAVPLAVRVKPAAPAIALEGERLLTLGGPSVKVDRVPSLKVLLSASLPVHCLLGE